jgi:hypothetical protein
MQPDPEWRSITQVADIPPWALVVEPQVSHSFPHIDFGATPVIAEEQQTVKYRAIPIYAIAEDAFGTPPTDVPCFACDTFSQTYGVIPKRPLEVLREMLREAVNSPNTLTNVMAIEQYYENKIRVPHNMRRLPNEEDLPPWPASLIHEHLFGIGHGNDAEKAHRRNIRANESIVQELRSMLFRENSDGTREPVKQNLTLYREFVKAETELRMKDPSKMFGYSAGAHVTATSQGPIATRTKRIIDEWNSKH